MQAQHINDCVHRGYYGIMRGMRMRYIILTLAMVWAGTAQAQTPAEFNANLDVTEEPICFTLINEAPYSAQGRVTTAEYMRADGIVTRHRSNFKLDAAGTINPESGFPTDRAEFCSYGPFMAHRSLEVDLRTLFPVFACQSRVDQGDLIIKGFRKREGGAKTWIECYNADGGKTGEPPQ